MRTIQEVLDEMHKIINPGEWSLGTERASIPDDDKAAWVRLGQLHDELSYIIYVQELGRFTEEGDAGE